MTTNPLPIRREETGPSEGVVTVTLESPGKPVVILNRELIRRLDATLDLIGASARGFVLASASERVFVAGADLTEIDSMSDRELDDYLALGQRVYGRIAHLHCPTVAAINGAALGGGLEIAMHCDAMIACLPKGAKPYQIGLPESSLGLCPGWGGTNMLPARMDPAEAIRVTALGKTFDVHHAREARLLDELIDNPADLLAEARELAATLTKTGPEREPRNIHEPEWRETVREALGKVREELPRSKPANAVILAVQTGIDLGWEAALGAERHLLGYLRKTPETKELLRGFFARSK